MSMGYHRINKTIRDYLVYKIGGWETNGEKRVDSLLQKETNDLVV